VQPLPEQLDTALPERINRTLLDHDGKLRSLESSASGRPPRYRWQPSPGSLRRCLTVGLIWQFVLVAILIGRKQRTLHWSTVRKALWLRSPKPAQRPHRGRVWLIVIPFTIVFAAFNELIPTFGPPENRVFATLVESDAGKAFLDGAWGWYSLIVALLVSPPCSARSCCSAGTSFRG
jgi:hypothetical protein